MYARSKYCNSDSDDSNDQDDLSTSTETGTTGITESAADIKRSLKIKPRILNVDPNRPKRKYVRRKPTKAQLRAGIVELQDGHPIVTMPEVIRSADISTQTCNLLEVNDDGFLMDIALIDQQEIVYEEYQALKRFPDRYETEQAVVNLMKLSQ